MNDKRIVVIGCFQSVDGVLAAARELRRAGFTDAVLYSPVNSDELQFEPAAADSSIGLLALGGAAGGAALGLILTIRTSTECPLITGGQPIISLPPFLVISFELTILLGGLATVLGMFWGIHRSKSDPRLYDPRFSVDRFGVHVVCEENRIGIV